MNRSELEAGSEMPLILVVEDDLDLRLVVASELRDQFEVIEAGNGKEGLAKALEFVPDLVVSDVMMPLMDGLALAKEMENQPRFQHVPFIFLSALTDRDDMMRGYQAGADVYLTKPINMDRLLRNIDMFLGNKGSIGQNRHQYSLFYCIFV